MRNLRKEIMKNKTTHQIHELDPVYDSNSEILILGSFPSVLSREVSFYYGNPKNRFWMVLSKIYDEEIPNDISSKKSFLLNHNIALWDVVQSCDICGSSDSTIKNIIPVDLTIILEQTNIKKIYVNGKTAFNLYYKYLYPIYHQDAILLPSTSPANAAYSLDLLYDKWSVIKN